MVKKLSALFMNKIFAAVALILLFAIALWLIFGQGLRTNDFSVADTSNLALVQTSPAAGTAIKSGDTVQFQLQSPGVTGQTLPPLVIELSINFDTNALTLVDVVPNSSLLSLNKAIDNTLGKGTIDVASTDTIQALPAGYVWATFTFTAKNTTTTLTTITGSAIVTYNGTNNQPIQGTTSLATSVSLTTATSSASASSSSSASTTTTTASSTSSVASSSSSAGGTVCGPVDVDANVYLDIVDFAAFARLYNKTCTSHTGNTTQTQTTDYVLGQTATLDLPLNNVSSGANAVDVAVNVTGASVTNFVPTTSTGWLSAIGFCNSSGATFTSNSVCAALAKSSNIISGETAGKLTLSFNSIGNVTVSTGSQFAYSSGTGKIAANYNFYTLTVGSPSSTGGVSQCGNQDSNNDSVVDLNDFSHFGRIYRLANCGV